MYTDESLQRAKAYEKHPKQRYPSLIEALSCVHVSYMVDHDILDRIDFEFSHGKGGIPYFIVTFRLKDDVVSELITLQHQQIF